MKPRSTSWSRGFAQLANGIMSNARSISAFADHKPDRLQPAAGKLFLPTFKQAAF
jgi:hypothetical protein